MQPDTFHYDNKLPKMFAIACIFWGAIGMLLGVIIAFQLAFPALNFSEYMPYLTFGRVRPVHTNAVIFAFVGNAMFAQVVDVLRILLV